MKIVRLFLVIVAIYSGQLCLGQSDESMLIFEISGNKYEKKTYDKSGSLKTSQMYHLGKIISNGSFFELPMTIFSYDKQGQLLDSAQTKLKCDLQNRSLFMSIFPFSEKAVNKTVILKSNGPPLNYLQQPKVDETLQNVEFEMTIEGGALDFFGSRTVIELVNRQVTAYSTKESEYEMRSIMSVKSFLVGLKIWSASYQLVELISTEKGLVEQKFTESDGSYFTIKLM